MYGEEPHRPPWRRAPRKSVVPPQGGRIVVYYSTLHTALASDASAGSMGTWKILMQEPNEAGRRVLWARFPTVDLAGLSRASIGTRQGKAPFPFP